MFWLVSVLWPLLLMTNASAFYDPGLQRWINRDPLGDIGNLVVVAASSLPDTISEAEELAAGDNFEAWCDANRNLYGALGNNLVNFTDSLGLSPSLNPANQAAAAECVQSAAAEGAKKLAQEKLKQEIIKKLAKDAAKKKAEELAKKKLAQKASEKMAKDMAKEIERRLGKEARREFHDAKSLADRTVEELRRDAKALFDAYGKDCPAWMTPR